MAKTHHECDPGKRPGSHLFAKGNTMAAGHRTPVRRMLTQQLIAALNEAARDLKTGVPLKKTNVRDIVDQLIVNARSGDLAATKEIFDRVEGRAVQGIEIEDKREDRGPLPAGFEGLSDDELAQMYRERTMVRRSGATLN